MTEPRSTEVDPARVEALRRRLYQPDASEEDRRRFSAVDVAEAPAAPPADPLPAPAPAGRLLRPVAVLAAVAGTALAVVLLVTGRPGPSMTPVASGAAAVPGGSELRRELAVPQPGAPTATPIPTSLAGVDTRLQRFHGRGGAVVAIDASEAQQVNGTLLVMLTATPGPAVTWAATRPARQPGHGQFVEIVATGEADRPGGLPAYGMHVYDGSPPSRLLVEDRGSDAWTLTVAFLPRGQSEQ